MPASGDCCRRRGIFGIGCIHHVVVAEAVLQVQLEDRAILVRALVCVQQRPAGEARGRLLVLDKASLVVEPAAACRDGEVVGQVEAELAEQGGLLQLWIVDAEKPSLGRRQCIARESLLVFIEIFESRRFLRRQLRCQRSRARSCRTPCGPTPGCKTRPRARTSGFRRRCWTEGEPRQLI